MPVVPFTFHLNPALCPSIVTHPFITRALFLALISLPDRRRQTPAKLHRSSFLYLVPSSPATTACPPQPASHARHPASTYAPRPPQTFLLDGQLVLSVYAAWTRAHFPSTYRKPEHPPSRSSSRSNRHADKHIRCPIAVVAVTPSSAAPVFCPPRSSGSCSCPYVGLQYRPNRFAFAWTCLRHRRPLSCSVAVLPPLLCAASGSFPPCPAVASLATPSYGSLAQCRPARDVARPK